MKCSVSEIENLESLIKFGLTTLTATYNAKW